MQSFDNSVEPDNPATIGNDSGKLWEKSAGAGDCPQTYRFGEFEIDPATRRLLLQGKPVALRNRPFEVLLYLVRHRGRLVEQSELLGAIWGASDVYHDALRKAVGSIRSSLGDDSQHPRFVETYWGKGYRFIGEVIEVDSGPETASLSSLAVEAVPAHLPPESAGVAAPGVLLSSEKRRPRLTIVAAAVAAAVCLCGVTFAIRGDLSAQRTVSNAEPAAWSSPELTRNDDAERAAYLEAQYLLSQRTSESITRAIATFNLITQTDPRAADAYAGLAECYGLGYWEFWKIDPQTAVEKSAEYARRAVLANSDSGYAHAQLAAALFRQLRVGEAQREFERALAIRPNDAEVHHAYAVFLDDTHHADRGIQEMKRAIDLEPLSLAYKTDLGMSYFFAKRYADAIAQYKSVLKLDPGYVEAHEYLASMYVYQAQWAEARTEYAAVDRLRGNGAGDLGQSPLRVITEFRTGDEKKAQTGVQAILASPSATHSYALAKIYAQLGMPEDALRYLGQVVNSRSPEMFTIPEDPLLSPLHGNAVFETLASKVSAVFTNAVEDNPVQAAALVVPGTISQ